ncbi:MAG: DUF2244 domain-containing protein [Bauldia sp.]
MSEATAAPAPVAPLFAARLTPHRSLGPRGFLAVMALIGAISFAVGLCFWWIGAWPVVGFLGLDVLVIYIAFRINFRAAEAYEEVAVTPERLTVAQVDRRGRRRDFTFNPYWTRLEIVRRDDWGVLTMRIASHGKRLTIGSFLHREDRARLAERLEDALAAARAAPSG